MQALMVVLAIKNKICEKIMFSAARIIAWRAKNMYGYNYLVGNLM